MDNLINLEDAYNDARGSTTIKQPVDHVAQMTAQLNTINAEDKTKLAQALAGNEEDFPSA
jgi:hypothetical protein